MRGERKRMRGENDVVHFEPPQSQLDFFILRENLVYNLLATNIKNEYSNHTPHGFWADL